MDLPSGFGGYGGTIPSERNQRDRSALDRGYADIRRGILYFPDG